MSRPVFSVPVLYVLVLGLATFLAGVFARNLKVLFETPVVGVSNDAF